MDIITQDAYFRQRFIKYFEKHGATKTSIRFRISRKTIYKWVNRYDGTLESLKDRSHRPHNSPKSHTEEEIKLIKRLLKKHDWIDLLLAYQEAKERGYARSYGGFKRVVARIKNDRKKAKKKRKNKPYKRASYPGEKVQIDVKFVPSNCVVNGNKYYQYTATDECTRFTYREMYDEHSTYSSLQFLTNFIKNAPFPVREIQTDNGTEFTNALLVKTSTHKTLFEQALIDMDIKYHRIRIATPRHNGKVERQHRTDEMRFYKKMKMFNLEDGRKQLKRYQKKSNNHIKVCLNMKSPNEVLASYLHIM